MIVRRAVRQALCFVGSFILTTAAWAAPKVGIADLVGPETVLVFSIDDYAASKDVWEKSALGVLFKSSQFKDLFDAINLEAGKNSPNLPGTKWLEEAGIKSDELPSPTGALGLAVVTHVDPKTFVPTFRWIALAQFGTDTDKIVEAMDKTLDHLEKKKLAKVTEEEVAGLKVRKIELIEPSDEDKDAKAKKPAAADDEDEMPPFGPDGNALPFKEAFIARTGDSFMLSSDKETLERAIDALGGKAKGESLATSAGFANIRKQHPAGTLGYAAAFVEPIREVARRVEGKLPKRKFGEEGSALESLCRGLQEPTTDRILNITGVKGTEAMTYSMAMDTDTAVIEVNFAMLQKERKGVMTLIESAKGVFTPPSFVSADAASVVGVNFRFDKVLDTARSIAQGLKGDERAQLEAQLMQAEPMAGPVLATLGPEVYIVTFSDRPFSAESGHVLVAIKNSDATPITNLLAMFGAQAGLKPRDFEGNQIFAGAMGMDVALGIGLGHIFIGKVSDVENALRLGKGGGANLAGEPRFRSAQAAMPANPMLTSYSDSSQMLGYMLWTLKNPGAQWDAQAKLYRERGIDEKFLGKRPEVPKWVSKLPELDTLLKHIGDGIMDMTWTDEGLKLRFRFLRVK